VAGVVDRTIRQSKIEEWITSLRRRAPQHAIDTVGLRRDPVSTCSGEQP
jgi:hypothetical protein